MSEDIEASITEILRKKFGTSDSGTTATSPTTTGSSTGNGGRERSMADHHASSVDEYLKERLADAKREADREVQEKAKHQQEAAQELYRLRELHNQGLLQGKDLLRYDLMMAKLEAERSNTERHDRPRSRGLER